MSEVPVELKFLSSHEWVLVEDNVATIGVSDHAQELLGDLVYVELPEQGSSIAAGDSVGVIESVKAASDIYAPISGEVIEVNDVLEGAPEKINNDPYGDGWMYKVAMEDPEEVESLLDAEAYTDVIAEEE
ncbi:MAG: glycine cleavage system protein GcvH [Gammaproteobacteria bacterium]|nr:glycine cleavage system protein GcvH [Gammaproteobacteria bacterium]MDH3856824.1 glycine cleavage system protein GcvH [Gammaproteobacteria bacterium]